MKLFSIEFVDIVFGWAYWLIMVFFRVTWGQARVLLWSGAVCFVGFWCVYTLLTLVAGLSVYAALTGAELAYVAVRYGLLAKYLDDQEHVKYRASRFVLIEFSIYASNFALLWLFTSYLHFGAVMAQLISSVILTALSFLNAKLTFALRIPVRASPS